MTENTKKKKTDNLLKSYLSNNSIFADIINYYFYDGNEVIKDKDLKELDTTAVNENDEIFEKTRDLFKEITVSKSDGKNDYVLFGIENQTSIDYEMVSRVLLYDALSYRRQFKNKTKDDIIKPVVTIVIYYGKKKWKAPKSLHDMFKIEDKEILKYIPDYQLNLIEPYQMNDSDIDKLKSEFKILCDSIRCSDKKDGIDILYKRNYNLISKKTSDILKYLLNIDLRINEEDGEIPMCKAFDEFEKRAINQGINQGIDQGKTEKEQENIKTMHSNGFNPETIAKALSLDINYVKKVLAK